MTASGTAAATADPTDRTDPDRAVRAGVIRWCVAGTIGLGVLIASYLLAVQTVTGQRLENAVLRGALQANPAEISTADRVLGSITVTSLGVAVLIVVILGCARGGWRLGLVGGGIVVVPLGIAEVLKRWVLPRPDLVHAPTEIAHNSFPSGHTTIAMGVTCAVLVVVPWRFRLPAMLVALAWLVGVGAYTVTARWHRVSDTLGGNGLVLATTALAFFILVRWRLVEPAPDGAAAVVRNVILVILGIYGVGAAALGSIIAVYAADQPPGETADYNLFLAGHSLASAGSVFAVLLAWWGWRRLTTGTPAP